jgi:hypothetical protein
MLSPRKEMMKMAAMSPARCPGAASAIRVRLTPSSASPNHALFTTTSSRPNRLPVGDIQLDREDRVTVLRDQVVQRAEVPGRRRDLVAAVQGRDRPLTAEAAACHR